MTARLFTIVAVFLICTPALGLEISAQGVNHHQALNNALRQAVEQTLGVEVESNTLVENFQVVRQQLLSHSKGFVKNYRILNEETSPEGIVSVVIDAIVDDKGLKDSQDALSTLMKMAAHPRVFIAARDDEFDALSSLNENFRLLTNTVEAIFRDEFHFKVIDAETARLQDQNPYRFTDRARLLKRAQRIKADYIVFVEVVRDTSRSYKARLETIEVTTALSLGKQEQAFRMDDWAAPHGISRDMILQEAKSGIYTGSVQIAEALVKNIEGEVYGDGQRYELTFIRFNEDTLASLSDDLALLSGYVRHKVQHQQKNALVLSYWSMLKAGSLQDQISTVFKVRKIPFNSRLEGRKITYRYYDPMFD